MLHASGHLLLPEFLCEELHHPGTAGERGAGLSPTAGLQSLVDALLHGGKGNLWAQAVEALERVLLTGVLRHTQGHQTQACELLGISRNTLRQKLRALGFAIDRVLNPDGSEQAAHEDQAR